MTLTLAAPRAGNELANTARIVITNSYTSALEGVKCYASFWFSAKERPRAARKYAVGMLNGRAINQLNQPSKMPSLT